ncbi:MAG: RNA-binding protein [Desulfobulbaceae bacterium]|nr:RNA-binding protein [Desulfobulbaceae bacterium]
MSLNKKDFYGKEVTDAIKKACESFGAAQEKLDIEVVETGSTGIFGLIRKKAHIRVALKPEVEEEDDIFAVGKIVDSPVKPAEKAKAKPAKPAAAVPAVPAAAKKTPEEPVAEDKSEVVEPPTEPVAKEKSEIPARAEVTEEVEEEASSESVEVVKAELLEIVKLMGFPSTLDVEVKGLSISCTLRGDFESELAGVDGKVLDSLQYLLRKVVSRKVPERLRIALNVGDFRERRLDELKEKAVELATQVKEDGKTQVLPALNPSERRAIHMILQEDKEIRSRSVGDGLFKKILIYKPGKGNRGGRKRSGSRGRQGKGGQNQKTKRDS